MIRLCPEQPGLLSLMAIGLREIDPLPERAWRPETGCGVRCGVSREGIDLFFDIRIHNTLLNDDKIMHSFVLAKLQIMHLCVIGTKLDQCRDCQ